jgi:integrase
VRPFERRQVVPRKSRSFYLWQRPQNGVWHTCKALPGRKVWRRSSGSSDKTVAEMAMPAHIQEFYAEQAEQQNPTLGFLLDNYRIGYAEKETHSKTNAIACHMLKARLGDIHLRDWKQSHAEAYVADRKRGVVGYIDAEGKRRGYETAGGSTSRRELVVLLAAVNWSGNREYCKTEGGAKITIEIDLPAHNEAKDVWLREDQVETLIRTAEGWRRLHGRVPRVERFMWLVLGSFARRGAIEQLKWSQVDWDLNVIHLNPPGRKQTAKRRASVTIADWLLPKLQQWYDERIGEYILDHPGRMYESFLRLTKRAGFGPEVTPHTMRHTGITLSLRRGEDPWKVAGVAGLTMKTMDSTYAHHTPEHGQSVVDKMVPAVRIVKQIYPFGVRSDV